MALSVRPWSFQFSGLFFAIFAAIGLKLGVLLCSQELPVCEINGGPVDNVYRKYHRSITIKMLIDRLSIGNFWMFSGYVSAHHFKSFAELKCSKC